MSAYWAAGGNGLLDTVGGDIERWGRERTATVVTILWVIVALKAAVAIAAPVLVGLGGRVAAVLDDRAISARARVDRRSGAPVYGGALTTAGLLVEAGVVEASADADPKALAWHAYLWDPVVPCLGSCVPGGAGADQIEGRPAGPAVDASALELVVVAHAHAARPGRSA